MTPVVRETESLLPETGEPAPAADLRRCWGCRGLHDRAQMRWGTIAEGPIWYPRRVRVLRCTDCLDA